VVKLFESLKQRWADEKAIAEYRVQRYLESREARKKAQTDELAGKDSS